MKRVAFALLLIIFCMPAFAAPGFGYSIAPLGEESADKNGFGALAISASFSPSVGTHVLDLDAEVMLSYTSPYFNGLKLRASSPLFWTERHIFSFLFPNPVYWAPKVAAGAEYRMPDQWALYFSLSPLSFFDTSFSYEFFAPYGLYDFSRRSWGWGMYIMRFSVFFGV